MLHICSGFAQQGRGGTGGGGGKPGTDDLEMGPSALLVPVAVRENAAVTDTSADLAGTYDAVIVGGGLVGCSIAHELARSGRRTLVLDEGPAAGAGSTSSSSAIVRFHYSTFEGVAAAWESKFAWETWADHLGGMDPAGMATFHRIGGVVLEPPGWDSSRILHLYDRIGIPYERWDTETLHARMPAIDAGRFGPPKSVESDEFWEESTGEVRAFFQPDGGYVDDPQLAAHNLFWAAKQHGAEFRFRTEVVNVIRDDRVRGMVLASGEQILASIVINATGPGSSVLNELAHVVDDMNVRTRPLRQEVHTLSSPPSFSEESGSAFVADLDMGTYYRPQRGGTLIVGGMEPECDPLEWVEDPHHYTETPTPEAWDANTLRLARRMPELTVPNRPKGLGALYDVSDDWLPIYDRSSLPGYYMAIGTSGNQFKNAPVIGLFLRAIIDHVEDGHDHDADPVQLRLPRTGLVLNLGHYSRRRERNPLSSNSVNG